MFTDKLATLAGKNGRLSNYDKAYQAGGNWYQELEGLFNPYIQGGIDSTKTGMETAEELLNQNVPETAQYDTSGIDQLIERFSNNQNIPDYIEMDRPEGPDYDAAQQSGLYKQLMRNDTNQLMNNAARSGMSARGGNANLGLARAASNNTVNVANNQYQTDLNAYQQAQQNNQYRNALLTNQMTSVQGLQNLKNQINQGNFNNQMNNYQLSQQNLNDYLQMMQSYHQAGMNANNQYGQYGTSNINSLIGSLGGIERNKLNAQAAQQQNSSSNFGNLMNIAGTAASLFALSDPRLKKHLVKTGKKTRHGFDEYQWSWNNRAKRLAKRLGIRLGLSKGVNALDVERTHPHLIYWVHGYRVVNYEGV